MRLSGKVALVTGTSPNIGGGIAEGLAAEGAALVCVDARAENADDCARYLKSINGRAIARDLRRYRLSTRCSPRWRRPKRRSAASTSW